MPKLGIGASLSRAGLVTPGIITDNLVMKHNYTAGAVVPISDGSGYFANNGYINCGTDSSLAIGNGNCTMSAWVYSDNFTASYSYVLAIGNDATGESFGFGVRSNDGMFVSAYSSPIVETAFDVPEEVWNHIAVVYTGGATDEAAFYCNGKPVETESIATNVTTGKITIGSNVASTGQFHTGNICNVGLWTEALTPTQISSIAYKNYAGLTTTEKENLVSWWNLDEETATDGTAGLGGVKDYHGSNHGDLE